MTKTTDAAIPALLLGEAGSDPIEDRLRETMRATVETIFEEELAAFLGRIRYGARRRPQGLSPRAARATAYRHVRHGDRQRAPGRI